MPNDLVKLVIVVPTLDSYLCLPRLVDSLIKQTWSQWSVLFVDGPSSHNHRQWLAHICLQDSRFKWIPQASADTGIFGAMNDGFFHIVEHFPPHVWVVFWGSDDWAATSSVLEQAMYFLNTSEHSLDLLVCRARYVDSVTGLLGRLSAFHPYKFLSRDGYRRSLVFGSTPPHQGTILGPSVRKYLANYDQSFRLSADLDYFLKLSKHTELRVLCIELELVHMSDGGVSGQQTQRRFNEVYRAYRSAFGLFWLFPFFMRYLRRLGSFLMTIY